jgi:hypothetical protein
MKNKKSDYLESKEFEYLARMLFLKTGFPLPEKVELSIDELCWILRNYKNELATEELLGYNRK